MNIKLISDKRNKIKLDLVETLKNTEQRIKEIFEGISYSGPLFSIFQYTDVPRTLSNI